MLQPLEEPEERYVTNTQWPKDTLIPVVFALIPIIGWGSVFGSLVHYYENRDENAFNIAECARKTALFGVAVQAIYVAIYLVVFL